MHISLCEENTIRIPFFVGDDKSRTWVFTMDDENLITLKHDHRHKDGSEDKITQYGGANSNTGLPNIQIFHADQETGHHRYPRPSDIRVAPSCQSSAVREKYLGSLGLRRKMPWSHRDH